ncbi:FadR family transcriptional regulator [Lachnospiraceae bacterium MD1]|uniref:FadR family transcriptional regulator n=1 Tax=Variimorphobacter saccharofermentans TaxID=2755051 RepID=A0A839K0G5_9FIRM|nr:FadR/GntR family transcriptional regulator [Variimorphobacter saccharofermentans]MBB2183405.1 FadR family transcriptional regulator [Variimorphobacter saccharofermentans]
MNDIGIQKKSYTKVIDYIKEQIQTGALQIGSKLPAERELSERLGISRNSVREAIRTLDIMGVISSQQGAGNYLIGNFENNLVESISMMFLLNKIDYNQISQLRRGLEMQAIWLAIDHISDQEIEELKRIITLLEKQTEENNIILDKKLHYTIAKASRNVLIFDILQALSDLLDKFIYDLRKEILSEEDSRERLMKAHNDMVMSIVNRDKELAYEAINNHFGTIDEKLKEYHTNSMK